MESETQPLLQSSRRSSVDVSYSAVSHEVNGVTAVAIDTEVSGPSTTNHTFHEESYKERQRKFYK